jgi:transcriptional regulatory protein LevR
MNIEKKIAWKNQKCNECGEAIYQTQDKENIVYFCYTNNATAFKLWKLCEKCFKKIFSEEIKKKLK